MFFLTTQPLWLSAIILVIPPTLLAAAGPCIVRHYVELSRLRTNNQVAGFKFATVGVLYAVLLAFAVVVVWQKFNQADGEVAKEAGAAATVFRLTDGIDASHAVAIRRATAAYLRSAIGKDWPAMEHEGESAETTAALNAIYRAALRFPTTLEANERLVMTDLLHQVDRISDGRRERLVMADGIVPDIIWIVLFTGATLTIGFTFFFGTENLLAQAAMTAVLSVLIFVGMLTIVAIDHPFAGSVKVGPDALAVVVRDFAGSGTSR